MGFNLLHLNLHGLIRSHDLELGRDADTGGQTLYVLELVKGLASRPEVDNVDLITRLIFDRRVSIDYSQKQETIAPGAQILRFSFGPKRYLRKELLWPYLDDLADQLVVHLQSKEQLPDWIHAHYADAGYVGSLVSRRLGIPFVFTGHSLGREKQRRLLAGGVDHDHIEQTYSISKRIEAEEITLAHSNLIITSTKQEVIHQYARYGTFNSKEAEVVPPGVDATRFHSLTTSNEFNLVNDLLSPFLKDPSLPPLLTISRAVRRKNIPALVEAFGRSPVLRKRHNLVLVLGCREDLRQLDKQQRDVFQQVFELVDKYDLYGQIAYPKKHRRENIPSIYRWAASLKGLFVNPALTEPFGLTLLEAAACGLPIVSTDDGGPRDILARCENGLLTDVTDLELFQASLEDAGSDNDKWRKWRDNGIEAVSRHFSWDAHVCNYLARMQKRILEIEPRILINSKNTENSPIGDRLLLLDLDSSLEELDQDSFNILRERFGSQNLNKTNTIGVLTGRSVDAARHKYTEMHLPDPQVWVCRAGTEIYYGNELQNDILWESIIRFDWNRNSVEKALSVLKDHIVIQNKEQQGPYKVSYLLKKPGESILPLVRKCLVQQGQAAIPYLRCHWYLDIVPMRASRPDAIRHLSLRWNIPIEKIFVIASQQGDAELIKGLTSTLVPADHDPSLESFRSQQRVFFATRNNNGLYDGLKHYRFFINR